MGVIGTTGYDEAGGADLVDSTDELTPLQGESPEDYGVRILKILQFIMKTNSEAMGQFFEILANGDKNKAAYMMEVLEKNLDQLKKQERSKGLRVFLKILSVVAMVFSALVVLINPTPFAVAMLLVSLAMFMEPMVAEAAGYESLVGQAFKELFNLLKEMGMPVWASAMLMSVVVVAVIAASSYGLATLGRVVGEFSGKAIQALGTTAATTTTAAGEAIQSVTKAIADLMAWLKSYVTGNLRNIVFAADMTALLASNTAESAQGVLKYQVASSQVGIDKLMAFVDVIVQSMDMAREDALEFKKLMHGNLEQIERMNLV